MLTAAQSGDPFRAVSSMVETLTAPKGRIVFSGCGARAAGRAFPDVVTMLKPGRYRLAVSVGKADGTPEIALPLEGQAGTTRRYILGKITVRSRGER